MKFFTETGSIYQIDTANKKIRRLSGTRPATSRIGENEWKKYLSIADLSLDRSAIIVWGDDVTPLDPDSILALKTTITSKIVSIEEDGV